MRWSNETTGARDAIRESYWFVPGAMTAGAIGLALLTLEVDRRAAGPIWGWLFAGNVAGAREILSVVASTMITVAGVVFSISIVALSLAASQFGPRVLRRFMRDRGTQLTLGTFVATYVFCLMVLRKVGPGESQDGVPELSVTAAVALTLASLSVLIYFIHHVARSLQAPVILAGVAIDLRSGIDALYPEPIGEDSEPEGQEAAERDFGGRSGEAPYDVLATKSGYVVRIDPNLVRICRRHDLRVAVLRGPGGFVAEGEPLLRAWPADRALRARAKLLRSVAIGLEQTVHQNLGFAVDQLVQIALRALSPAINDPITAESCIRRAGAALATLAARRIPPPVRLDEEGHPRVFARAEPFGAVADRLFDPLGRLAANYSGVLAVALEEIASIAEHAFRRGDLDYLSRTADRLSDVACAGATHASDRARIQEHRARVHDAVRRREDILAKGVRRQRDAASDEAQQRSETDIAIA